MSIGLRRMRPGAPLKVAFFGEFGCGNLGNEASLTTGISWVLRRPRMQS